MLFIKIQNIVSCHVSCHLKFERQFSFKSHPSVNIKFIFHLLKEACRILLSETFLLTNRMMRMKDKALVPTK